MVFYVGSINCTKHHMRSKQDVFGRHFWEVAACILSEADGYNFGGILFYCTLAVETRTHVVNASDVFNTIYAFHQSCTCTYTPNCAHITARKTLHALTAEPAINVTDVWGRG